ncbi:MAG: hypothetical protein KDC54_09660 [Lewinella sp.]|nr:hypothetical protein [Lewinella sp.]
MQILKSFSLLSLLFALTMFTFSCGGSEASTESGDEAATEQMEAGTDTQADQGQMEEAAEQGPEYTSAYVCPMHCKGSGSDEPGKCPVCGMDYVANADHADHMDHEEGHEGHNH